MATEKKSAQPARQQQVIEEKVAIQDFASWFKDLYTITNYTDEDILQMYETFKYVGFERKSILQQLFKLASDTSIAAQIIVACALRGPKAAAKLKLTNGRTIEAMGIPASGAKGTSHISCNRVTAATADLAAYFLKKMNVPKRLHNQECPAWLQFPSAGSIKLPENLKQAHRQFATEFSKVIGGTFNASIYNQMELNAYLSENLNLF
jgi:hypothetical protein